MPLGRHKNREHHEIGYSPQSRAIYILFLFELQFFSIYILIHTSNLNT